MDESGYLALDACFHKQRAILKKLTEWQPISTAPKTGQPFIARSGSWMTVCAWNKHRNEWCPDAPGYAPYPRDEQPEEWVQLVDINYLEAE